MFLRSQRRFCREPGLAFAALFLLSCHSGVSFNQSPSAQGPSASHTPTTLSENGPDVPGQAPLTTTDGRVVVDTSGLLSLGLEDTISHALITFTNASGSLSTQVPTTLSNNAEAYSIAPGSYDIVVNLDPGLSGSMPISMTAGVTITISTADGDGSIAFSLYEPFFDPFTEGEGAGIRFQTTGLDLAGSGPVLVISQAKAGLISATLGINQYCPSCGSAFNQIIVGIGGQDQAQACIWDGGWSSFGLQSEAFNLTVPAQPGVYYVRARYAQGWSCDDGIGWWKIDRPDGPTATSNIGIIIVTP